MIYSNDDYRAAVACENARLYEPEVWDEEPEDDKYYSQAFEDDDEFYEEDFDTLGLLED